MNRDYEEVDDQAAVISFIMASHLRNHPNNEPDPTCEFCKGFIIPPLAQEQPMESYSFVMLDLSDPNSTIKKMKL